MKLQWIPFSLGCMKTFDETSENYSEQEIRLLAARRFSLTGKMLLALDHIRNDLNENFFMGKRRMSWGATVELLIHHYLEHPPEDVWVDAKANEIAPKLGRPRKAKWS